MTLPSAICLQWVSPSAAETMRVCPLQLAYRMDSAFRALAIPSTWAMLGTAAHGVLEAIGAGTARSRLDAGRVWEEVLREETKRVDSCSLLGAIPPPHRWRAYHLARERALRFAEGVSRGAPQAPGTRVTVERRIEDVDTGLAGQIDLVEEAAGGPRIVDYKSALRGHEGITPQHRRQLLAYAFLWHSATGTWPSVAAIRYLDGTESQIAVVAREAQNVAISFAAMRQQFNAAVDEGRSPEARPSSDGCRYCDFRAACADFLAQVNPGWAGPPTLLGRIESSETSPCGQLEVAVAIEAGNVANESLVKIAELPCSVGHEVGTRLAFSHLTHAAPSTTRLRATWETRVWPQS